jgi:hypothetical protein
VLENILVISIVWNIFCRTNILFFHNCNDSLMKGSVLSGILSIGSFFTFLVYITFTWCFNCEIHTYVYNVFSLDSPLHHSPSFPTPVPFLKTISTGFIVILSHKIWNTSSICMLSLHRACANLHTPFTKMRNRRPLTINLVSIDSPHKPVYSLVS